MTSAKDKILEVPTRIEPARLENPPEAITDLVAEISTTSTKLGSKLHPKTAVNLADIVRLMNTYYSNLIEGHNTRPRDIERALSGDFDEDEGRRNLQIEAAAHVRVQVKVDRLHAEDELPEPASSEFIKWLHQEFYKGASQEMLMLKSSDAQREILMVPGEWRSTAEHDVAVGRHIPPSSSVVEIFMAYFEKRFAFAKLGAGAKIIAMATAHHRFNFIHPFPDGNGRVSRLMSHAMALDAGIGAHGLWSVSRGLARGLESRTDYKSKMDMADTPRQGDIDGRGNLSEKALVEFTKWFLSVCLDQISFMNALFDLENLEKRYKRLVETTDGLSPETYFLFREALVRGEFERGEASRLTGLPERTARRILNEATGQGLLASSTPKGPVSLRFPVDHLEELFPKLYPVA